MVEQIIPAKMKAAVYGDPGERMSVVDVDVPAVGHDEILVKIVASSLCGSDLVGYNGWQGSKKGTIGGHEAVGKVAAVGTSVTSHKVGDAVGFLNCRYTCGGCVPCLSGHHQFCESGKENQGFGCDGFLAEYGVTQSRFAVKINASLPLERMSPLFCAGITAFGAVKLLNATTRKTIAVFGLGGVGQLAVRFAKAAGHRVIGIDVASGARDVAAKYGAIATVASNDEPAMEEAVRRYTEGLGFDHAIVAAGAQQAYSDAVQHTGFNGTIITVGIPHAPIGVNILACVKKRLRIQGTQSGSPLDLFEMMQVVQDHSIVPEIELFGVSAVPDLMHDLATGKLTGKVGILFRDPA